MLDRPALRFAIRRLIRFVVSVWVLLTAAFGMIYLIPGDPVRASLGINASQALVDQRRHALGLDQPLLVQYGHYLAGLVTGNFGTSLASRLPVSQVIAQRLPATLELAGCAFGLAVL
ncbi:MAG TPA: ABC transporter permease, partial [Pseudonocardiaceae bacterium]|nr:ABC transporter permease [Pseudonocardiaceae bacterium]